MLGSVPTTPKSIEGYRPVIGDAATDEILRLGARLRGARVLHVNATAFGGGVAEILGTLIPLMNDVGLDADWQVIKGADEFFNVTKAMHNSLQGMYYDWTPAMRQIWLDYNKLNADLKKALATESVKGSLSKLGMFAIGSSPDELARFIDSELNKFGAVIKTGNISVE